MEGVHKLAFDENICLGFNVVDFQKWRVADDFGDILIDFHCFFPLIFLDFKNAGL